MRAATVVFSSPLQVLRDLRMVEDLSGDAASEMRNRLSRASHAELSQKDSNAMLLSFDLYQGVWVPSVPSITSLINPNCNVLQASASVGSNHHHVASSTPNACAFPPCKYQRDARCVYVCCVPCAFRQILMIAQHNCLIPGKRNEPERSTSFSLLQ